MTVVHIQQPLGHTKLETTMRYLRVSSSRANVCRRTSLSFFTAILVMIELSWTSTLHITTFFIDQSSFAV